MESEEKKQHAHDHADAQDSGKNRNENKNEKTKWQSMRAHLLCGKTWLRILFIILFVVLQYLARIVAATVIVLQTFFVLFTGERNKPIAEFAASLALYIYQLVQYICYLNGDKPFPFQAWPQAKQFEEAVTGELVDGESVNLGEDKNEDTPHNKTDLQK